MAVSANNIITRSMQALKALGSGEVPTAAEANDGLILFNAMLDSWSLENLNSYVIQEQSFVLTIGTNSYTIGSGGVINTTRPTDIVQAYIQDANNNNFLMKIVPRDKWNQIGNRGNTITSQIPDTLFYDPQFPLGVINVFPTPLLPYTLFFDSTLQQVDFANLTTNLSMPIGYERTFVLNLALEMVAGGWPSFLSPEEWQMLMMNAKEAKANVKRANIKDVISDYDPSIISRSYATYNIFRDSGN